MIQTNTLNKFMLAEAKEQEKIRKFCINKWHIVINITKSNFNWIPDLLIPTGNWKHIWCEVKKVSWWHTYPVQLYRKKQLETHWDVSLIAYWYEDFVSLYSDLEL